MKPSAPRLAAVTITLPIALLAEADLRKINIAHVCTEALAHEVERLKREPETTPK